MCPHDCDVRSFRVIRTAGFLGCCGNVDQNTILDCFGAFSPTASEATGYRELVEHILGRQSLDDAIEQIKIATRQLARRQMKWFRCWSQIKWIAGDRPLGDIVNEILTIYSEATPTINRP